MKTSLKNLEELRRELIVELPIKDFMQKVDSILHKMAKDAKIDGFRKGKVPIEMLRKRFEANAKKDATNEIISETLGKALTQEKIEPAHQPSLSKIDETDSSFIYTINFEIFPVIELGAFEDLEVEKAQVKITKEDEDQTLNDLKQQATEYKAVKRKSKIADELVIDFTGFIDGEKFDGGQAENFKLVLGKGSMIAGFEDGLIGFSKDDNAKLELVFPEKYHAKNLAGKPVVFDIKIKEVNAPQAPKEGKALAEKFGEKDMDSLREGIKKQINTEVENRLHNVNKSALFDALIKANDFTVPNYSIAQESENLKKEMEQRMQQQGMDSKGGNFEAKMFEDEAKRRVKLGLVIGKIASDNKISASKEQVDAKLQETSQQYGENAQKMIDYYQSNPQMMQSIELLVVEKMVADFVLEKAKITLIDKTFTELTQQQ